MKSKMTEADIVIESMAFPNKGIGYLDGVKVEVKNALPGQTLRCRLKKKKGVYTGRILAVEKPSLLEKGVDGICPSFSQCGGCTFQSVTYEDELKLKQEMALKIFRDRGIEIPEPEMVKAPRFTGYRNKMEYSFGDEVKGGQMQLGMRKRNSMYEVAYGGCCNIADPDFGRILDCVLTYAQQSGQSFYHKASHEGVFRHLVIRKGFFTGEILVNLVTASSAGLDIGRLSTSLSSLALGGRIVGILHTENDSVADIVKADKMHVIAGRDYFFETLLGLQFRISPFSFFQTNSWGAELLYSTIREFAGDECYETIFDLYCGTGTIAQILSPFAKKVYGIELVEEAVAAAKENAFLNGINNCAFIAGDVLKQAPLLSGAPGLIVLDPPREGIHPKAIHSIIAFGAKKLIYVSCKPTSLANDLAILLEAGYVPVKMRLHDMFPRSYHIEAVVLLVKLQ